MYCPDFQHFVGFGVNSCVDFSTQISVRGRKQMNETDSRNEDEDSEMAINDEEDLDLTYSWMPTD